MKDFLNISISCLSLTLFLVHGIGRAEAPSPLEELGLVENIRGLGDVARALEAQSVNAALPNPTFASGSSADEAVSRRSSASMGLFAATQARPTGSQVDSGSTEGPVGPRVPNTPTHRVP